MIYITGANGRLGKEVLKLLPEAIPLVRKESDIKNELKTDFSSEQLEKIFRNATAVIHLAGSMNFINEKEIEETNVELTKKLIRATPKNARFVFASSYSVYGKNLAEIPATEETEVRPDTHYAKSKLKAEEAVKAYNNNSVLLRIGTIYGKGFDDYYRILRMIKNGKMSLFGKGNNRISFVHVEDVAKAVVAAVETIVKPGIYLITGESLTQKEIYSIAAKEMGVAPPKKQVLVPFALLFAWLEEEKAKLFKTKPKLTREHVRILSSDRVFDYSKAEKELGFKPRKLKLGIEQLVTELNVRQ